MIKSFKIISLLITLLLLIPTISLAAQYKVTRVYDGDTIKAKGHDITIKVRLVGIDAPETSKKKRSPSQPYSKQAKKHLTGLILNKVVAITGYGLGPYNRILGVVSLNNKNINLDMIRAGLAEVYRGRPPKGLNLNAFWQAEKRAKEHQRGMWSLGNKYISPRDWRKTYRKK